MKKIIDYYEDKVRKFGDDAKSVGWRDRQSQWRRFEALAAVTPLEGKSILDLGCGLGHFYEFLQERDWSGSYTGWDLSGEMVAKCREKYPDVRFEQVNVIERDVQPEFDVVVGSGLFCIPLENESFYYEMMKKLFGLCREAAAFNFISTYVDFREDYLRYTDPRDVFDFCKRNLSRYVALRHDYMPFEFAVYVYRKEE